MNDIKEQLRIFNEERDWDQFHSPENLAKSVAIEAGELLECFQWNNDFDQRAVSDEIADVMMYLSLIHISRTISLSFALEVATLSSSLLFLSHW